MNASIIMTVTYKRIHYTCQTNKYLKDANRRTNVSRPKQEWHAFQLSAECRWSCHRATPQNSRNCKQHKSSAVNVTSCVQSARRWSWRGNRVQRYKHKDMGPFLLEELYTVHCIVKHRSHSHISENPRCARTRQIYSQQQRVTTIPKFTGSVWFDRKCWCHLQARWGNILIKFKVCTGLIIIIIIKFVQSHSLNFRGAGGRSDQCSVKTWLKKRTKHDGQTDGWHHLLMWSHKWTLV